MGIADFLQPLYDRTLRRVLPRRVGNVQGVRARGPKLLDLTDEISYEAELVEGIQKTVQSGDHVVIVGGGRGISTVHAARTAGIEGHVDVFDPVQGNIDEINRTLGYNDPPASVQVRHAAVGGLSSFSQDRFGENDGTVVAPDELPNADCLVLDCEGTEADILTALIDSGRLPSRLVVESHGFVRDDAASAVLREQLEDAGKDVERIGAEDATRDIIILTAT